MYVVAIQQNPNSAEFSSDIGRIFSKRIHYEFSWSMAEQLKKNIILNKQLNWLNKQLNMKLFENSAELQRQKV